MRIGINVYPLTGKLVGHGYYIFYVLKYLEKIDAENEYYLYTPRSISLPFNNPRWHIVITKGLVNTFSSVWTLFNSNKLLTRNNIDLFWNPDYLLPISFRKASSKIKSIVTVHDLAHHFYPKTKKFVTLWLLRLFLGNSLRFTHKILVDSDAIGEELLTYLKNNKICLKEKISTIYLGVEKNFFRTLDKIECKKFIFEKYKIKQNYILSVSTIEPRKNFINLLIAFKEASKLNSNYQLVIVGKKGWKCKGVYKAYKSLHLEDQVKFLGYVDREDLPKLYNGANLFVFPSLYEGFGMPLLEAIACGLPCACSDIKVFREIAGEAAAYFNPYSVENISKTIVDVIRYESCRGVLINNGLKRCKLFSWQRSARELLDIFNSLS